MHQRKLDHDGSVFVDGHRSNVTGHEHRAGAVATGVPGKHVHCAKNERKPRATCLLKSAAADIVGFVVRKEPRIAEELSRWRCSGASLLA
jgi:hypothetical protein